MTGEGPGADRVPADDPRVTGERTRTVGGPVGRVTLVGSVHDHPASAHRAGAVVEALDPAVLAVELPPLALPLFEAEADEAAGESDSPGPVGGEMSAAIRAARTDRVVAIDGPSVGYLRTLAATLASERPPMDAVEGVLAGVGSAGREALGCRVGAALAAHTPIRLDVRDPVEHDCTAGDDPGTQAADERRQIGRARAVMDAFEPSPATRFRDETREAHMAERLAELRREGDVVAVVGHGHLDALESRLREADP